MMLSMGLRDEGKARGYSQHHHGQQHILSPLINQSMQNYFPIGTTVQRE